jgi:signal transduction histidine kinase
MRTLTPVRFAAHRLEGIDMLHDFLEQNRARLIDRCRSKVLLRRAPPPTPVGLEYGIPLFLGQLIDALRAEGRVAGFAPNDASDGMAPAPSPLSTEIEETATKHGSEMLLRGFTVNQVVHDYGDLCQSITELAAESGARIAPDEFNVLNRCLDDAIAEAVTSYQAQRERQVAESQRRETGERLGSAAHELRSLLGTAALAFEAMKAGTVGTAGATSAVLARSLAGMRDMINRTLAEVRLDASIPPRLEEVAIDRFIADVEVTESLSAKAKKCEFSVAPVETGLRVRADEQLLHSAVSNLLHDAFEFRPERGNVSLKSFASGEHVLIEIRDECGGLPGGKARAFFVPFEEQGANRTAAARGLAISRRAVEAMGGELRVRDRPGEGCVFTIDLPRQPACGRARHGDNHLTKGNSDGYAM